MTIRTEKDGAKLVMALAGRLDTMTVADFEKALNEGIEGTEELVIDMTELEYISSAGLRALLSAHKKMSVLGGMVVMNPSVLVREVFDITGFSDILDIR